MRNPFRSEVEAFHFVLLTIVAFAAVALASLLGGPWAGVPVWAVATVGAALLSLRRRGGRPLKTAPAHAGAADERRILVVVNETPPREALLEEIERAAAGRRAQVQVVAPAPVSRVRHWTSDVDPGLARGQERLDATLGLLGAAGVEARGIVGDEDPLLAIEDALRTFGADAIIVTSHSDDSANWLERGSVAKIRERYALPVTHLEVATAVAAR